ncbi:MAG: hypothetical protein ABIV06_08340 [Thermoanaerobaculia bacterium]
MAGRGERLCFFASLLLAAPGLLPATNYSISAFADGIAVDGVCRLREAIRAVQSQQSVNECPAGGAVNTITLAAAGTYAFIQGQELLLAETLTIRGAAPVPADYVIDLQGSSRFLEIQGGGRLTLEGLTVTRAESFGEIAAAGGALRVQGSELVLRDVVISQSIAPDGGGLWMVGSSGFSSLERVRFVDNLAEDRVEQHGGKGGGAFFELTGPADLRLEDVVFEGNRARATSPNRQAFGGGAYLRSEAPGNTARVDLQGLAFLDNEAESGVGVDGAGLFLSLNGKGALELADSRFEGNHLISALDGPYGSALAANLGGSAILRIRRVEAAGSSALASGTAQIVVRTDQTSTALLDSVLVHSSGLSGTVLQKAGAGTLTAGQLTVTGNLAGGVSIWNFSAALPRIENSLLWGNGPPGSPSTDLSNAVGEVDADRLANHNWIGDQGDPDPLFVDATEGDFGLQASSGAIDSGESSFLSVGPFDLNHASRIVGSEVDLGALEHGGLFSDGFESASAGSWSSALL